MKRRLMVVLAVISVTSGTAIAATKVTVKNGDNISGIAIKHHTTRNAIISANKLQNPDKLKLGQVLVIPNKADIKKAELKKTKAVKLAAVKAHKQALIAKQKKQAALTAKHKKAIAAKAKAKTHTVAKKSSPHTKVASTKAATSTQAKMVNTANRFKGVKYAWGGSSRSGFDCSGFTSYVVRNSVGRTLPHSSRAQFSKGVPVSKADLKPGDLVFFSTYSKGPSHVGIYVGNGKFVHASHPGSTVKATPLNSGYYKNRFLGARRVSH
ncbi:MAG: C40 family peptidase [Armatimonadota bacterium]